MSENREMLSEELEFKLEKLKKYISDLGSLAVGFSGGVDSSFLTAVAHEVLGDRLIAVTGADASVPEREVNEAMSGLRKLKRNDGRVNYAAPETYHTL